MDEEKKNFWNGTGKVLLILALVIGMTSLTMNLVSRRLETTQAQAQESPEYWVPTETTDTINILLAGQADLEGEDDFSNAIAPLHDLISGYDLAAYTQKALVNTDVMPSFANAMSNNGFDLVGLASRHALSGGKNGVDQSLDFWMTSPMHANGQNQSETMQNQLKRVESSGISIIYLSFTDVLDDPLPPGEEYLVNKYDDEKSPVMVAKAAGQADVVIVSMDWEGEDGQGPSDRQKKIADDLAYAGASVIIGTADNAIQPVQWIDDTLVFYSLGTFARNADEEDSARIAAMGGLTITKTTTANKSHVELTNPRADFTVCDGEGGSTAIQFLENSSLENKDDLVQQYTAVMQSMDDSIRAGGL
ncbi:MAG: CapA family protein [Bulleidia sp.]|nr:CapA family protein [Bulleidia sp.]